METEREAVASEAVRKSKSRLSVLLVSYQSGEKLYEALKSILDQTYSDMEIVVCDDGSDDFDEERLRAFIGDRAVKLLHHPENVGTVHNLNDGLSLCSGEWILLLAADDVLAEPNVVSELMKHAEETEKAWLVGSLLFCNKDLEPVGRTSPTEFQMDLLRSGEPRRIWGGLCRECFLPSGGNLYRKELLECLGGFDTHYRLVEDWPLFLRLVRSGNLPEMVDILITLHRANGVSQKAANRNRKYQRDLIETMNREILPYLDMLPKEERKEIETLCRDKKAVYRLRFEISGFMSQMGWAVTHLGTVIRKIMRRGGKGRHADKL